jgi:translation initiation factor 2-alpha kinase 1
MFRPLLTYVSSYKNQFQETGFIASGGFGNVFKAIHKLDEVEYAIKKIVVRPERVKTIIHHLEEVKTLAKLNHTNIVSYKQAWIEPMSRPDVPQLPSINKSETYNSNGNKISYSTKNSLTEYKSHILMKHINKESYKCLSNQKCLNYNKITNENNVQIYNSNSDVVSFRSDNELCDISIKSDIDKNIVGISRTNTEESFSSDDSFDDCRIHQYSTRKVNLYYT